MFAAGCAGPVRLGSAPVSAAPVDSIVRVALARSVPGVRVSSTSLLSVVDGSSGTLLSTGRADDTWEARPGDSGVLLLGPGGARFELRDAPLILRSDPARGWVVLGGRRYRGTLVIWRDGEGITAVNHVPLEEYLDGVVPLEIGTRRASDAEAIAAQAIAARSYTWVRVASRRRDPSRLYDLQVDVSDQVYGGVDAENELTTQQIRATRGQVLTYGGRVVEAVYSASCGGATADASEVWTWGGQPYLRSVADTVPGGNGFYCDVAPNAAWTTTLSMAEVAAAAETHLRAFIAVEGRITSVDSVLTDRNAGTGRVRSVSFFTNVGRLDLPGERARSVLRSPSGAVLRSAVFEISAAGAAEQQSGPEHLEIRGRGNGHGVGMCQWGAIGRARAGQGRWDILFAYFPGTEAGAIK
jgi:stage II sporulation protein D